MRTTKTSFSWIKVFASTVVIAATVTGCPNVVTLDKRPPCKPPGDCDGSGGQGGTGGSAGAGGSAGSGSTGGFAGSGSTGGSAGSGGSAGAGGAFETDWVARYNGPGNGTDQPRAIAVDTVGNVYVAGNSAGTTSGNDYATIKYDASGNELWVRRYDGPAGTDDIASDITVDIQGNVYVTGSSFGTTSLMDMCGRSDMSMSAAANRSSTIRGCIKRAANTTSRRAKIM